VQFFLRSVKNRLPDPSELCPLDFKKGISPIQNLLGFSDYRHQSVDLSASLAKSCAIEWRQ
jgi:hypothetical protein